jgi:5-methylcytosine-specific restriction endonuclease McrA
MARPITLLTFTCAKCGVDFIRQRQHVPPARRAKPIYCSRKCASQARDPATRSGNPLGMRAMPGFVSTKVTLTCDWCGAIFQRGAAESSYYTLHFCTKACRSAHLGSGAAGGKRKPSLPPRICERCGALFYATPYRVRQGWGKFCSLACANQAHVVAVPRACLWCGTVNQVIPSRDNIYCNRECRFEHMRADPTQHVGFLGGRVPYYGANWYRQRARARERDGHTCQRCGLIQRRPALHVHHIRPRRAFAGDYVAANDLANLVTLCLPCHRRVETTGWPLATPKLHSG